jgi:hypothetical protein
MKNSSIIRTLKPVLSKLRRDKKDADIVDINGRVDEAYHYIVRGWVSSKSQAGPLWVRVTKGEEVQVVLANQVRADVMSAGLSDSENCGYRVVFLEGNHVRAKVDVLLPAKRLEDTKISYANRNVFFMHIPKTAGSSVNEFFNRELADHGVYTHIEGMREKWGDITSARVLSGHIRLAEYDEKIADKKRIIVCFFREPYRHLESHLNWVRHLSEPSKAEFLSKHPIIVARISKELSALNFSSAEELGKYVNNLKTPAFGLFDNPQVRFLSSVLFNERVTEDHLSEALNNLNRVKVLGLAEEMDNSFFALRTLLGLVGTEGAIHVNSAPHRYGMDSADADCRTAVNDLVRYDLELYAEAKKRFSMQCRRISEFAND